MVSRLDSPYAFISVLPDEGVGSFAGEGGGRFCDLLQLLLYQILRGLSSIYIHIYSLILDKYSYFWLSTAQENIHILRRLMIFMEVEEVVARSELAGTCVTMSRTGLRDARPIPGIQKHAALQRRVSSLGYPSDSDDRSGAEGVQREAHRLPLVQA